MSRTVVIHQPDFLPWLGFFNRLMHADLFIVLDHVQFVSKSARSWMNRDFIKTKSGAKWLTVSVRKTSRETSIRDVLLSDNSSWRDSCIALLYENYRKSRYFHEIFPLLEKLICGKHEKLLDINIAGLDLLFELLNIKTPRIMSSDLRPLGRNNEMLIDLLQKSSATHYLSGTGARSYLDVNRIEKLGIRVVWQDYKHPVYPQLHGDFIPYLSAIDALFNCGPSEARSLL